MGNVSDFFAGGGGSLPGGMTKDPRLLPCYEGTASTGLYDNTTLMFADVVGFWEEFARVGAVATTSTDDTYTEICDITGSGVLFHVVSQTPTNTTDDVTFRITVDGVEYVIAKTQTWASVASDQRRIVLGCATDAAMDSKYTVSTQHFRDFAGDGQSTQVFRKNGRSIRIIPPSEIMNNSMPCLRFEESLKVEVKVTDVFAGTYSHRCGATYILD